MIEELEYDSSGRMTTCGPEKYKIPSIGDIPTEFNVHLLKDSGNPGFPKAVYSSKVNIYFFIIQYHNNIYVQDMQIQLNRLLMISTL